MLASRPRVRRSFGGKEGIWWRERTRRECSIVKPSPSVKAPNPIIGWDADLCRPIYYASSSTTFRYNDEDDESCISESDDTVVDDEISSVSDSPGEVKQPSPVKQRKCFHGLRKRPLPILIDTELKISPPIETRKKTKHCEGFPKRMITDSLAFVSINSTEISNENRSPQDPNLKDNDSKHYNNESIIGKPIIRCGVWNRRVRTEGRSSNRNEHLVDGGVFDFTGSDNVNQTRNPRKQSQQPNAKSSINEARSFFNSLDATEKLTLDGSSSPRATTSSGRVFRTSRNFNISSPRLEREYSDYVRALEGSGVSPLKMQEFAMNRDKFCGRQSEIFDGFLN